MAKLEGYPYFELEFDKDSHLVNPTQVGEIITFITSDLGKQTSDLFVISHGWNNDIDEARQLYAKFFSVFHDVATAAAAPVSGARNFAVMGIFWPSKKFADADLIPGGAAALNSANVSAAILLQHKELADTLASSTASELLDKASALVPRLEASPQIQDTWVSLLRQAVQTANQPEFDGADNFLRLPGNELFEILRAPAMPTPPPQTGGGAAQLNTFPHEQFQAAASLGGLLGDIKGAALRILNFATYYIMKNRAGLIGRDGLNPQIARIQSIASAGIQFHLIGHSFGGRLMTAATNGPNSLRIQTLTLLQAAYSHYGMAQNYDGQGRDGYFRAIISEAKVTGPILVTHSVQDLAVGIAYAIASRIARQIAAAIGDPNDPYGGIGRNGAQKTPEAKFMQLQTPGSSYAFSAHLPNNLNGDQIIQGHSDICRAEVAGALIAAL
jgi:hypothetical protein